MKLNIAWKKDMHYSYIKMMMSTYHDTSLKAVPTTRGRNAKENAQKYLNWFQRFEPQAEYFFMEWRFGQLK